MTSQRRHDLLGMVQRRLLHPWRQGALIAVVLCAAMSGWVAGGGAMPWRVLVRPSTPTTARVASTPTSAVSPAVSPRLTLAITCAIVHSGALSYVCVGSDIGVRLRLTVWECAGTHAVHRDPTPGLGMPVTITPSSHISGFQWMWRAPTFKCPTLLPSLGALTTVSVEAATPDGTAHTETDVVV